jgi:hypothetical protein
MDYSMASRQIQQQHRNFDGSTPLALDLILSLVDLVIGGTSLLRGLPGLPSLLLRFIRPEGLWLLRSGLDSPSQLALGRVLGTAAQAILIVAIVWYLMPFFGLKLLHMARHVAAFDLPARVWQLFGVSL